MSVPNCRRYLGKNEDFAICAETGEKGFIGVEHPDERYTLYQYIHYGKGKFGVITDSGGEFIPFESDDSTKYYLADVKEHLHKYTLFQADSDFSIIGFNTLDKNVDWDGKVITESFTCYSRTSYLICFDGNPIVNGKKLNQYDYAKLDEWKSYNVDIGDGFLAHFIKKE